MSDMSDEMCGKNCLFPLIIFISSIIGLGVYNILGVHPATKEQQVLLSKMKESGYEWNADTLEMSKTKLETKFKIGN